MSEPEALRPRPRSDPGPVFDEPWQAEVLAIAFALVEHGLFSAAAWSRALGEELRHAAWAGAPDTPETYYRAVLTALERLIAAAGASTPEALAERTEAWRRAYLRTPHGEPVELAARSES